MKKIAIFASGTGSNAQKIVAYFEKNTHICVSLIVSNRADAAVLDFAKQKGIETLLLTKKDFYESEQLLEILAQRKIDFIALAGFLWLAPSYLVRAFERRMVNIHPALLPDFGGQGMYGHRVHEAVKAAGRTETGISIHFVNENYDEGNIIFQVKCDIYSTDSVADIAQKVLALEHQYFAPTIESLLV